MAKYKKKQAANKTAKPANQLQSLLTTGAALSLAVITLCFAYLALIDIPMANRANVAKHSAQLAQQQASLLNLSLSQLQTRLSGWSANGPLLLALNNNDQSSVSRYQQQLKHAFPEAISTKLITLGPLGIAALDKKNLQLRNNIEFDLIRRVSNGDKVQAEAYEHNQQWLLSLVAPIKADDKLYASGALMITLDAQYLNNLLTQIDVSLGETRLVQIFRGKQRLVTTIGSGDSSLLVSAATSLPHWQIQFAPAASMVASNSRSPIIIWILLATSLTLIAVITLMTLRKLQKSLASNLGKLQKLSNRADRYTLPGFASAASALKAHVQESSSVAASVAPAEPELTLDISGAEELVEAPSVTPTPAPETKANPIPDTIFRAYDIRGLADQELTDEAVFAIGLAIGSEALDQGQQSIVVCADGRHSSPRIRDAMVKGLLASGRDVIDIGMLPTPLMYFATHQLGTQSGVMITGSHNPAPYNGIKIVIGGRALSGQAIKALHERIRSNNLAVGQGEYQHQNIEQAYIDYIINDVAIAQPLKIVIDAGNGIAGAIAPQLFEELGCEVIPLYCEVDGDFPNHHPDPSVEANLEDLKTTVLAKQADLGIAFDGDGDRLGVVTASGKSVAADRLLMLFAQDVVSRNPGADVIFDVKCTRNLNTLISNYGGRPIMWKTGHSFMKEKMAETGALLGGEFSGHIFFKERWFGFDDGMYAAARLIEILSTSEPDLDLQLAAFPTSLASPELKVATEEAQKFIIIEQLIEQGQFEEGKISTLDGVRVDYSDGWGLVRASNTTPMLILRFEADNSDALSRIQNHFKQQLSAVDNSLHFDF